MNPSYPTSLITLGDHIRKIRLDRKLLQKDVARIIEVDEMTVTNWENNRVEPMSGYNESIISFLGFRPDILDENMILGERLKAYRMKNHITQKQLALQIGIGLNTFRNIENNGGKILIKTKKSIRSFLT